MAPKRGRASLILFQPGDIFRIRDVTYLLLHAEEHGHVLASVLPSDTFGLRRVEGDVEADEHLVRSRSTRLVRGPLTGAVFVGSLTQDRLFECIRAAAMVRGKRKLLKRVFPPEEGK